MTVNEDRPDANPAPDDPLTVQQRGYVERATALAEAARASLERLAEVTGSAGQTAAMVYAAAFGVSHVLMWELLAIVDDLAGRVPGGEYQDDDGTEPYCVTCGEWIGHFLGMDGWHHYLGDPAPGGARVLYDADHEAVPAECVPPGRVLSPAGLAIVRQALADASAWRTWRTGGDRDADTAQAAAYEQLLRRLVTGEEVAR